MNASTFNEVILEAKNVSKFFGTITALKDANLSLRPGEVLGVVGDNGAGKSTLMKVLSGLYNPSEGSIYFEGKEVFFSSPRDSQDLGIEMVYQDLSLAENLPIGDNIFLGREPTRSFGPIKFLDHKKRKQFLKLKMFPIAAIVISPVRSGPAREGSGR